MLIYTLDLFIPILCLLLNICVQVTSFRLLLRLGLLASVFLGFILGFLSLILLEVAVFPVLSEPLNDFLANAVTNVTVYFSLGYCYFCFINLGETARRIRILRELFDAEDGLSLEELLSRYNAREIINRRLNRLLGNGQIILDNGRYYIKAPLMLLFAQVVVSLKFILLAKKSEFE